MIYELRMRYQLKKRVKKVVFMSTWRKKTRGIGWGGKTRLPDALMLHHTAGAVTDSTDPANPGNKKGANMGQVRYIQNHFRVPAANFTLDRDGTVYVHSVFPVWHAGKGSFFGKSPWDIFGIPRDAGNDYLLGVEIVSKGIKKDFTAAQKRQVKALMQACGVASRWPKLKRLALVRRPQHKDWTPRKVDTTYKNREVDKWML